MSFIRVPRHGITGGPQEVEEWKIASPANSFRPHAFAVCQPENLLALVEWKHPRVRVVSGSTSDHVLITSQRFPNPPSRHQGLNPHHLPQNGVMLWATALADETVVIPCTVVTTSRLMIPVVTAAVDVLIIWNWRTGA